MVNLGSLPRSKMEFFVMIANSIAKIPILDVPRVYRFVIVTSGFGYSVDVLPRWHEIFNLKIVSIVPYTKESIWC